jgi:putative hydrolase of the HAD superfamily
MTKYKHYSFDLWLTLIKSDPKFKLERDKYLHRCFNRNKLTLPEVQRIVKEVDVTCNTVNEVAGGSISPFEMYVMILNKLGYPVKDLTQMDLIAIYHYIEGLFLKHPPQPYCPNTFPTLMKLREKGATLSLLSNTGFITGDTIEKMFDQHFPTHVPGQSARNMFSFRLYSDRFQCSKPSLKFYQLMGSLCENLHQITDNRMVMHVGDNPYADEAGAKKAGFSTYLINSNNNKITDLLAL